MTPRHRLAAHRLTQIRSLLAFAAHPDDIESWCAGTLALAADAGAAVQLIIATSGAAGAAAIETDDLGAAREREARAAAQILGIREPVFLRLPDGGLAAADALPLHCREAVARYRPDLILSFDPDRPWSERPHADHVAIGRAAIAGAGSEIATWLFSTGAADCLVDIGPVFERKLAARLAHRSQTTDRSRVRADWAERARTAGAAAGLALAEAFRTIQ